MDFGSNRVSRRVVQLLITYLAARDHSDGIRRSLVEIGRDLGVSHATVKRGLNRLQEEGVIKVIPAAKPTEPNIIKYLGQKLKTGYLDHALSHLYVMENHHKELKQVLSDGLKTEIDGYREKARLWDDFLERLVSSYKTSDGRFVIIVESKPGSEFWV